MGEYEQAAAHNFKSIVLNAVSLLVFLWPFSAYSWPTFTYYYYTPSVAGAALLALLVPPMGWKRPHPYSDQPKNVAVMKNKKK